jgi:hypothetical protein
VTGGLGGVAASTETTIVVVAAAIAVALKLRPKKLLPIAEKTDGLR